MGNVLFQDIYRPRYGHDWTGLKGSNISFVCVRCGIVGYLSAKESGVGIKTNDDCDHHVVEIVLSK